MFPRKPPTISHFRQRLVELFLGYPFDASPRAPLKDHLIKKYLRLSHSLDFSEFFFTLKPPRCSPLAIVAATGLPSLYLSCQCFFGWIFFSIFISIAPGSSGNVMVPAWPRGSLSGFFWSLECLLWDFRVSNAVVWSFLRPLGSPDFDRTHPATIVCAYRLRFLCVPWNFSFVPPSPDP